MEKIANKAGVHKRVAQVWFQNARARQKKEKGKKKGTKFSKLDNH
jgi:phosphotransferase system HPr-like phosphotransfer protein